MTGQKLGKCIVLCLLPWSCLSFAWSDAAGPGAASLGAGHVRKGLPRDAANGTDVQSNMSVPCTALPPPRYGYYYVDRGSGVSVGSVLVYWCQEGYQLVGSERLTCLRQESTSSWSHPPPQCQGKEPSGAALTQVGRSSHRPSHGHFLTLTKGSRRWGHPAALNGTRKVLLDPVGCGSAPLKCLLQQQPCNSISGAAEGRVVPGGEFT
uniref:Sushi domain-containing protein n=1 Tax=Cyanistes caeruleus TaxID=156563 RepID=A0A8C0UAY4_CYACU